MDRQAVQVKFQFGKLPAQRLDFNLAAGDQLQFGNHVAAYALTEGSPEIKAECNDYEQDYGPNRSANPLCASRPRLLRRLDRLRGLRIRCLARTAKEPHPFRPRCSVRARIASKH